MEKSNECVAMALLTQMKIENQTSARFWNHSNFRKIGT